MIVRVFTHIYVQTPAPPSRAPISRIVTRILFNVESCFQNYLQIDSINSINSDIYTFS